MATTIADATKNETIQIIEKHVNKKPILFVYCYFGTIFVDLVY